MAAIPILTMSSAVSAAESVSVVAGSSPVFIQSAKSKFLPQIDSFAFAPGDLLIHTIMWLLGRTQSRDGPRQVLPQDLPELVPT
jgi:hypothetical protein